MTEDNANRKKSVDDADVVPLLSPSSMTIRANSKQNGTFSTICNPMPFVNLLLNVKTNCATNVEKRNIRKPSTSLPGSNDNSVGK